MAHGNPLIVDLGQTGTRGVLPSGEAFFLPEGLRYGDTVTQALQRALDKIPGQPAEVALLSLSGMRGRLSGVDDVVDVVARWCDARRVGLCDDGVAWNLGALAGGDGAILAVGGGVVSVARSGQTLSHSDGCGADLGDDGGARWLGRKAVRSAMRAIQARDTPTKLAADLVSMTGPIEELPTRYLTAGQFNALCLQAAPLVLGRVDDDQVAAEIAALGAKRLAATALAAVAALGEARAGIHISLCGGLMREDGYRTMVQRHIADALPGAVFKRPEGDALDGLSLLSEHFPGDAPPLVCWRIR